MTQIAHPVYFNEVTGLRRALSAAFRPARHFLRRAYAALLLSSQRQAERDIARLVRTRGRFTDSLEREISDRMQGRSGWNRGF